MDKLQDVISGAERFLKFMPDPMCIIDPDDRIVWINDAYHSMFGRDTAQLDQNEIDFLWLSKNENRQWNCNEKVPIRDDEGGTIAFTVVLKQRMKRHTIDVAVVPADEKYRIIAENTSDTIVLVDHENIVHYVSPSIESLVGSTPDEYKGMNAFDLIHPDDSDRVRVSNAQVIRTKLPIDMEYRLLNVQGSTVYIEARVKPVMDSDGEVQYVVAVARDVTERKKTEQLLENILENVNAAVWSTDKDFTRYTFCSESIEKLTGLNRQEILSNPIRLHDQIHPEDNAALMGEVKRKLDMGIPVREAFRLIHVAGETRWGRLIVHPQVDHTGAVERLDGIILDITEKKRADLALEESEQRYKSLFENNLDGVFSIELRGFYFVSANRSFERITGIKLDQLTDRCFMGLIVDEDHAPMYETLFEVIQQRESRHIECRINRYEQGEKIVSITFVPIFLSGELSGIHGIVKDITQRKKEEAELIQSEERYKSLQQSLNRFSNDLANVMKVSELENRLIDEVKAVLHVTSVSVEEVPRGEEHSIMNMHDMWVKIGEKRQPVYLRITPNQAMLKIEKEWLETAVHYATILYDNLHFIEDLMQRLEEMVAKNETPKWMLRLLFKLSEKERSALSSDLHDSVLQDLIIWYRKLESLRSTAAFAKEIHDELHRIEDGLLDAIHQIRITCNELRPPFLLKMGLVESLKSLFSYTRMFANYEIEFLSGGLNCPLNEEQILGVYRIVQELLNNANKHSQATKVRMELSCQEDHICFSYSDDGVGMDLSAFDGSFQHMGIAGIEKRVLSLEGKVALESALQNGFHVNITLPKNTELKGERYGNFVG